MICATVKPFLSAYTSLIVLNNSGDFFFHVMVVGNMGHLGNLLDIF